MNKENRREVTDRRAFLKSATVLAGGLALAGHAKSFLTGFPVFAAQANSSTNWASHIGLELFTVRDVMTDSKSYVATLEKIAAIGYKEIEPAGGYAGMEPKDYKALLDRLGLSMPTTHSGATEGPDLEKQLEGFQIMGLKYIGISAARAPGGPGAGRGRGAFPQAAPETMDAVKRTAAQNNEHGRMAKKFGMKILIHNHTQEFAPLADNPNMRPYDVLLSETDPDLVAMQMDIGWAIQAGQDPIAMFKKNPGRYELWHVKDMSDINLMPSGTDEAKRMEMGVRAIVPIGLGDIDYKPIFAAAGIAGMKHFCIEQDTAADWGDSVASARVCYNNLAKIIS